MRLLIELSAQTMTTLLSRFTTIMINQPSRYLRQEYCWFLHNTGFEGGGRRFKLYISRLTGAYRFNSDGERSYTSQLNWLSLLRWKGLRSLVNGIMTKIICESVPFFFVFRVSGQAVVSDG